MRGTEEGKKSNKKILRIVLIVAIIAVIVVVIVLINQNKGKASGKNASDGSTVELPDGSQIDLNNLDNAEIKEGKKVNNSERIKEAKEFDGYKFSDVTVNSENGETNFVVTVTNISTDFKEERYVKIVCVNQNDEEIGTLYIAISQLEAGESINASAVTSDDYINMYDYRIENND